MNARRAQTLREPATSDLLLDPYAELQRRIQCTPSKPFLIDAAGEHSFDSVGRAVTHFANRLIDLGFATGDRVGIWMPNCREFVYAQLACHALGGIAVPLNPRLREHDLAFALNNSSAKFLVVGQKSHHLDYLALAQRLRSAGTLPTLEHTLQYVTDHDENAGEPTTPIEVPTHAPDDPAFIMFTSGTTADPKGVVLTRRNIRNAIKLAGGLNEDDVTLLGYPLSAITGCHNGILASLVAGGSVILYDDGDLNGATQLSIKHAATHLAVHRQVLKALGAQTSDGTVTFRKTSTFPRNAADAAIYEQFGVEEVIVGYGMTETCGPVTHGHGLTIDAAISGGCDGWTSHGADLRIAATSDSETADVSVGDILVRGPQVSPGYWNGPGDYESITDTDGWLRTGDVGEIRRDGSVHYVERRSDTFKSQGFTVSPGEIANLIRHRPGVHDCAVFGLDLETKGTVPVAVVETGLDTAEIEDDIVRICKESLASYKVPRAVLAVSSLPRTRTGKPSLRDVASRYGDELRRMLP